MVEISFHSLSVYLVEKTKEEKRENRNGKDCISKYTGSHAKESRQKPSAD